MIQSISAIRKSAVKRPLVICRIAVAFSSFTLSLQENTLSKYRSSLLKESSTKASTISDSLPETFVALGSEALGNIETLILADESGTWYYTDDQTAWGKWYSHLLTPPEITNDALHSGLLEDLKDDVADFPEDGTVAEKLLFAAQNTSYYFYCVK